MIRRTSAFLIASLMLISFLGCSTPTSSDLSSDVEVIIEEEIIIEGEETVSNESVVNSDVSQGNDSVDAPTSSEEPVTSSQINSTTGTPTQDETVNIDYEWKSHPNDYKLLAFTFDDGPHNLMPNYVQYFAAFDGAGTFFVNGTSIKSDYDYKKMQNAIDYGWDIGNHGDNHLVATIGGTGGTEATYDAIKADITNLIHKLESNLKTRDGAAYNVSLYRPPNIKPTENTFKICAEENLAVIWLAYDALDWDKSKTYNDRYNVFKKGIGTWKDGDVILCHETSEDTYKILQELLPDFFRAGYRFCSITELMEMRGITIDQISGELNEVDGNRGMVTNIIDAAAAGKK